MLAFPVKSAHLRHPAIGQPLAFVPQDGWGDDGEEERELENSQSVLVSHVRMVRSHHKQPQVILCGGTCPDNKLFFLAVKTVPAFFDAIAFFWGLLMTIVMTHIELHRYLKISTEPQSLSPLYCKSTSHPMLTCCQT